VCWQVVLAKGTHDCLDNSDLRFTAKVLIGAKTKRLQLGLESQ